MKSVLIVDDSIAIARHLEKIINSDEEFEVIGQGRNGAEALKQCQELKPDIVCMDMNMPVMDGLTALRNLLQSTPELDVVMITSLGGVGDKFTEALRRGAKNVISKPFEKDNVLKILKNL